MENWTISIDKNIIPYIIAVGDVAQIGKETTINIIGGNFNPETTFEINWGASGGLIVSSYVFSQTEAQITISCPTVGQYLVKAKNGALSSSLWSGQHFINVVGYQTGWIDLSSSGPDLGLVESSLNFGQPERIITNSGLIRTADGLTKNSISDRVFACFPDFPIFTNSKISIIIGNYKGDYAMIGDYYSADGNVGEESNVSIVAYGTKLYHYSNDGSNYGYVLSQPQGFLFLYSQDYLFDFLVKSTEAICSAYKILNYGATHDDNTLENIAEFRIGKMSDGKKSINSFLGLGFWTTATIVNTYFKAFKIS